MTDRITSSSRRWTLDAPAPVLESLAGARRAQPLAQAVRQTFRNLKQQSTTGAPLMPVPARRRSTTPQVRTPWDPFREMTELQQRVSQLADSIWPAGAGSVGDALWSPPVDIEETDEAWIVEADLPGVKKSDITIELNDSELAITGEIKERERVGILRRRTRRTGQFEYRVTLPGDADVDKIDATLDQGVLIVRIPKPARARPRRIEIKS